MLLDSSGLLILHQSQNVLHAQAVDYFRIAPRRLIHNYLIAEFVALINARKIPREEAIRYMHDLFKDPTVDVFWVTKQLHDAGMDLLARRLDKTYSLCDAISFVLMRAHGITEALTTDHHFEHEGFTRLLK
jgi:predicted nucleic acid-binding protein